MRADLILFRHLGRRHKHLQLAYQEDDTEEDSTHCYLDTTCVPWKL